MTRWTPKILATAVAAVLSVGAVTAQAQPGPGGPGGPGAGGPGPGADRRAPPPRMQQQGPKHDLRHDNRHGNRHDNRHFNDRRGPGPAMHSRGAGPQHNWVRGSRVPPQYRSNNYVVNDWRGHRLSPPPRGYHWIQNGGDYLLVAIATGVIAQLILSNY